MFGVVWFQINIVKNKYDKNAFESLNLSIIGQNVKYCKVIAIFLCEQNKKVECELNSVWFTPFDESEWSSLFFCVWTLRFAGTCVHFSVRSTTIPSFSIPWNVDSVFGDSVCELNSVLCESNVLRLIENPERQYLDFEMNSISGFQKRKKNVDAQPD